MKTLHIRNPNRSTVGGYSLCGKWFYRHQFAYQPETSGRTDVKICRTCVKVKRLWEKLSDLDSDK